jgi:hypothetical protein
MRGRDSNNHNPLRHDDEYASNLRGTRHNISTADGEMSMVGT